ncbi:hypothetical protein [Tabrizicola sp.]|uniref:hypothetical protein n=1 Tax=Tabrizicola sp. TaxID=2005166 RepID=UPI00262AE121|nr:hypothetical protein [Tabrizicola sp.]MDM7931232.1 hypothetical protein [Tabrizicola sp.]
MTEPPQFSPRIEALAAAGIAAAALGGAGWLGWMTGWPESFDTSDPDFINPISIMVLGLLGIAGWFFVKAVGHARRHLAFGATKLEIDPPGTLRLGRPVSGRVRVQKPVAATGPFRLVLTCLDVHEFEDDGRFKTSSFPVWTAERSVPPETDATQGLPFRFDLPSSVGPDPVPSGILPGTNPRHRSTIHIPGIRKVVSGNTPPVGRFWTLVVTAPTPGTDFRAEVVVPTEPPRRKGRLP